MDKDQLAAALGNVRDDSGEDCDIRPARDPESQRLLGLVQQGYLPVLPSAPVPLYAGEVAHLAFADVLMIERRVVGEKVVGRSVGFTLFDDDSALSFGHSESHVVKTRRDVRVGAGVIVLTNYRFVFTSPQRGVSLAWPEVLGVSVDHAEVGLTVANQAAMRFGCVDPELVSWSVSACMARGRS
jgi:hypothetical protein